MTTWASRNVLEDLTLEELVAGSRLTHRIHGRGRIGGGASSVCFWSGVGFGCPFAGIEARRARHDQRYPSAFQSSTARSLPPPLTAGGSVPTAASCCWSRRSADWVSPINSPG